MSNKSIFSKIISREIPAQIIYEDEKVIAFYDAFPFREGHFLVVPKEEKSNYLLNDESIFLHAMKIARQLAKKLIIDQGIDSFKTLINTGANAGQTIFHTHIHIIPFKEPYNKEH
ncbi:histidine triad protein HinT [Mycoplasmopsis cricetuli]|uniref:histidine triad protein HinT n=1 Tax=Mycoplasmopsis cricetuli TaxID=171283 RepID=UPI00046FD539|nr:HIT family protein [Mycoplasmopsis cricetuli]